MSPEDVMRIRLLEGLSGNSNAYREFLTLVSVDLRRFLEMRLRLLGQPTHDLDDIVQETLIAVNKKRHTYDGEGSVTAWALAICRYKLIDYLRSVAPLEDFEELEKCSLLIETGRGVEAGVTIRSILSQLPEKARVSIELMKLEGLSAKEVAQRMGTSETAVRVSVHRGLESLARLCGTRKSNDRS